MPSTDQDGAERTSNLTETGFEPIPVKKYGVASTQVNFVPAVSCVGSDSLKSQNTARSTVNCDPIKGETVAKIAFGL
jgi:hypothetical protein